MHQGITTLFHLIRFSCLGLLFCCISITTNAASISNFRANDEVEKTRFVLELTEPTAFNIFTLSTPDRVIIDLAHTSWKSELKPHEGTKRIKAVRHANRPNHDLRIVLDMNQPVYIENSFTLNKDSTNPHRLVVDIKPTNKILDDFASFQQIPLPITKDKQALGVPKPLKRKPRLPRIVLDAGHGGRDPGAIGKRGTKEKDVNLSMAKILYSDLKKTKRYKVFLTRSNDTYLTLRNRVKKAEKYKADLFISIHADSHKNRKTQGLSVYTLSEKSSDKEAAALARKENRAGVIGPIDADTGNEIDALLIDLVQRDTKNISASFAETIVAKVKGEAKLLRNPHRFAGFRVLTGLKVPSVLVELGYLSNRHEEKKLNTKAHKKKLAKLFVQAIDTHFNKYDVNR